MQPSRLLDALKTFKGATPVERELITLCQFWIMTGDQEPELLAKLQRSIDEKKTRKVKK